MQRIKTSRILMLQIKPVAKLKPSYEKPAIQYNTHNKQFPSKSDVEVLNKNVLEETAAQYPKMDASRIQKVS